MWITTAGVPLAGLILLFSPVGRTRDLPTAWRPENAPALRGRAGPRGEASLRSEVASRQLSPP